MFDYRMYDPVPYARALTVFKLFGSVVDAVVVNKARALEEVNADYSTTTEIADALLQKAEVPFRIGHHFASKLTDYGRGKGLKIRDIPYREAARIYEEQAKDKLPLTEAEFREVISAEYMVFGRKGLGGPQKDAVESAILERKKAISLECDIHSKLLKKLTKRHQDLHYTFIKLF
jgi:argininosuccinate lyase